jgi:bifunctional DNA-binding transcriptional regulator/antitoxin component of YhaV-PrlF toxin-antitoxin module
MAWIYIPVGSNNLLMSEVATLKIDEQGRMTIPRPVRQALGIDGKEAVVRVELDVRDIPGDEVSNRG